jgi:hypothetical protein
MAFTRKSAAPALGALVFAALLLSACTREPDTRALLEAGMDVSTIRGLHELKVTDEEVPELLKVQQAGLSGNGILELVRIYRARNVPFADGDSVASLLRARLREETVLELARLKQLGDGAGEYQLMHMAGMSETLVLTVARRRAEGRTTVSGAGLAKMKNTGLREATLLELARRGISDADADLIFAMRRRGASESDILRRFQSRN